MAELMRVRYSDGRIASAVRGEPFPGEPGSYCYRHEDREWVLPGTYAGIYVDAKSGIAREDKLACPPHPIARGQVWCDAEGIIVIADAQAGDAPGFIRYTRGDRGFVFGLGVVAFREHFRFCRERFESPAPLPPISESVADAFGRVVKSMNAAIAACLIGNELAAMAVEIAEMAHANACPRCGGPATALLTSMRCERDGGCRTDDERIGEPRVESRMLTRSNGTGAEALWHAGGAGVSARHPTRDGAIALWREAALAAERAK